MGVCEPGQGGNAAAISNTFMCPGEPPRLSPAPAASGRASRPGHARVAMSRLHIRRAERVLGSRSQGREREHVARRSESPPRPQSSDPRSPGAADRGEAGSTRNYTVVARRYRPQRFEDVVGQDHVVQALRNAIRLNRMAQAYLFCGTRGVGKTSMARIFAKCLNCVQGPTETPCQICDICQAIAAGQDVDVIEIDGASNNGVEQVRELRQKRRCVPAGRGTRFTTSTKCTCSRRGVQRLVEDAGGAAAARQVLLRHDRGRTRSRSRSCRAASGLISRASRPSDRQKLKEICPQEQVEAEPEALQVVARRAGGSMRDAQSLLEQLLASGSAAIDGRDGPHACWEPPATSVCSRCSRPSPTTTAAAPYLAGAGRATRACSRPTCSAVSLDFLRDAMVLARRRRLDLAGGHAASKAPSRSRSSVAGRSTPCWPHCKSWPKHGPGCAAACTADCSSKWRSFAWRGWKI